MTDAIQVLVVADNLLARAGLAALLDNHPDCVVVGQTRGSKQLPEDVDVYQPDVVVYDLGWQSIEALKFASQLVQSEVPIVALLADEADAATVIATLASFFQYALLLNETGSERLVLAIKAVSSGLVVLDPALSEVFAATAPSISERIYEALTARENDVLQLLAQGLTNKGIAHQLGITEHTVKFHVTAIMTKLSAQSRTEAVVRATRAGLIIL